MYPTDSDLFLFQNGLLIKLNKNNLTKLLLE